MLILQLIVSNVPIATAWFLFCFAAAKVNGQERAKRYALAMMILLVSDVVTPTEKIFLDLWMTTGALLGLFAPSRQYEESPRFFARDSVPSAILPVACLVVLWSTIALVYGTAGEMILLWSSALFFFVGFAFRQNAILLLGATMLAAVHFTNPLLLMFLATFAGATAFAVVIIRCNGPVVAMGRVTA